MAEFKLVTVLTLIILLNRTYCVMESYVVGGDFTTIKHFPHSVFMSVKCKAQVMCGSSILNQKILLTAGHCFEECFSNPSAASVTALAGHENYLKTTVQRKANSFVVHKKYDMDDVVNDIALVGLKEDLPLGERFKRVIIMKRQHNPPKYANVAGWGVVDINGQQSTHVLKYVQQRINSEQLCHTFDSNLMPGMMCAQNVEKSKLEKPSRGDSGGALITDDGVQLGIVSFEAVEKPPIIVYTNVTFFYEWIKSHSKRLFCVE